MKLHRGDKTLDGDAKQEDDIEIFFMQNLAFRLLMLLLALGL